jgi:hypothetical protein
MARVALACLALVACSHEQPTPKVTLNAPIATTTVQPSTSGTLPPTLLPPTTIAWQWSGETPGFGRSFYHAPRTVAEGAITCTFTYVETPALARTACESNGHELWHADEAHAFVEDAALVLDRGTLYSARISNISTGCTLHAFDARTGAPRWKTHLEGLGRIAHSEYLNAVELHVIGGRPVVFGWESSGKYIEARDPSTGATAFHALL